MVQKLNKTNPKYSKTTFRKMKKEEFLALSTEMAEAMFPTKTEHWLNQKAEETR